MAGRNWPYSYLETIKLNEQIMAETFNGFPREMVGFYKELKENNDRPWFNANKDRYLACVAEPALNFIRAMEEPLKKKVSKHFTAIPKRSGGSLLRIYRDTRFSKNKTPYKTNLGIHFRHEVGKDVHAPGFYFHFDLDQVFIGAGVWSPCGEPLNMIRATIDDHAARWKRIVGKKVFRETFELYGSTLIRPPRGYEKDHPLIVDLKRKDHIALTTLKQKELFKKSIVDETIKRMKLAMPYVRFLCDALHLPS